MLFDLNSKVSGQLLRKTAVLAIAASSLTLTSCFDDNYDLSDIDTTVRVKVNDLTLPVNLDEITLKSIIDLDDESIIKDINGEYVLLRTGSFSSSALTVDPISISAPESKPSVTTFVPEHPATPSQRRAAGDEIIFTIDKKEASPINYSYDGVSDDIVSIDHLTAHWTINYNVRLATTDNGVTSFSLRNFVYQLPKGLTGTPSLGSYDPETGMLQINDYEVAGGELNFHMEITGVDTQKAGVVFDHARHHLEINQNTGVIDGKISVKASDIISGSTPDVINVTTSLVLSRVEISAFSGSVKYDIDDINIAPVELNDLPDLLSQPGTDIRLVNPQIYININNPFTAYGVHAESGFAINAIRDGQAPVNSAIDNGLFTITSAAESFYCLSPTRPDNYYEGFEQAAHVPFTKLATAFSGDGLPSKLEINLDPTTVPVQQVNDFVLGSYPSIEGGYVFYAPLALGAGSVIEYTDTEDGWNDEDLDKLTIESLNVKALLTTNLPFDIHITGYPVDKDGNQISDVVIEGADVKAGAANEPIVIHITGEVKHLDGIRFSARATSPQNAGALKPDQVIILNDLRATVSGYYEKEL